jgi:hypothetical protein
LDISLAELHLEISFNPTLFDRDPEKSLLTDRIFDRLDHCHIRAKVTTASQKAPHIASSSFKAETLLHSGHALATVHD